MKNSEILPAAALARLKETGPADLVVGIPSYNNARTIARVVYAVHMGLGSYFPRLRSLLVNSDGGSGDGTAEIVRNTKLEDSELLLVAHPVYPVYRLTTPYHGLPGKGSALRLIMRVAELAGARACAVVDADLRSITPEWVRLLLAPVVERGFDYVAPLYARHQYDGTITNSIVYPLTRALYGLRVRQPIGGEFGFSGPLASYFLSQPVWESDVARFGIDIWMTTTAICEDFRVCQAYLGAKLHDPKDPGADLSNMLVQVVGSVFQLMETHEAVWRRVRDSQPTPVLGFHTEAVSEPIQVNLERMIQQFRSGLRDLQEIWEPVLAPGRLAELKRMAAPFHIPYELWAGIIYDFALAYHRRTMDRSQLVRSLSPGSAGVPPAWSPGSAGVPPAWR